MRCYLPSKICKNELITRLKLQFSGPHIFATKYNKYEKSLKLILKYMIGEAIVISYLGLKTDVHVFFAVL